METHKGSKLQMQNITKDTNRVILENMLGQEVDFLCPKDFKEYQLNSDNMSRLLDIDSIVFDGFWPTRQPQWDGIAIGKEDKTLYLIEAKAHLSEIGTGNKPPKPTDNIQKKKNFEIKKNTLLKEKKYYLSTVDDSIWLHRYYQISNRLAFLSKTKELANKSTVFNNVQLVFLNFYNDPYWISKNMNVTQNDWIKKYHKIWKEMGITEDRINRENIKILCADVSNLK